MERWLGLGPGETTWQAMAPRIFGERRQRQTMADETSDNARQRRNKIRGCAQRQLCRLGRAPDGLESIGRSR